LKQSAFGAALSSVLFSPLKLDQPQNSHKFVLAVFMQLLGKLKAKIEKLSGKIDVSGCFNAD
jgi:hypothetical protein